MLRVFENRVLRRVFGPKRYVMKPRRLRWTGDVAGRGKREERCIQGCGGEP